MEADWFVIMPTHKEKAQAAKDAINAVHQDDSVPLQTVAESLDELAGEADILRDAVYKDIENTAIKED